MIQTYKALLIGGVFFIFTAFSNFGLAQNTVFPDLDGTWLLDSIQVQEVRLESVVQRAVQSGDSSIFNNHWMQQFTLNAEGKASYTEITSRSISDVPYSIESKNENAATLMIDGVPDYKKLDIELVSDSVLLITQAFVTGYNLKDVNFFWKIYYHKQRE